MTLESSRQALINNLVNPYNQLRVVIENFKYKIGGGDGGN